MNALVMSDLAAPMRALRLLAADFADLPAVNVEISRIYPGRLELSCHDGFAVFEAWREALAIPPETVTHGELDEGTRTLKAYIDFVGARLRLIGYSRTQRPVEIGEAVA
ncbi:hypothetical protein [Streptomyces noursei]|uniref:hypothetical protein n=1 Tax=Streptomyces noursei TaxID=1971 RepID=UPI0023B82591|nr:hypothetical protein [Streptomyces noursei]